MMDTTTKSYSEMCHYHEFEDRYEYLRLGGTVGRETFGFDRWMNQRFYASWEWKNVRQIVLIRDDGCDLGVPGREIQTSPLVHHINPMVSGDILHGDEWIINPEFLITTSHDTHNAIHFGDKSLLPKSFVPRRPGDTRLW